MGAKLIAFFQKETILCVAGLLAVISMIWIPPDGKYVGYINWQVLVLLFCLMSVMGGLQALGIFKAIANTLLHWANGLRQLTMLLVLLCFFFAMVVTNDVALITFVPFTILLLQMADLKGEMIPILVLQTIAANLGSMLTPIEPVSVYGFRHVPRGFRADHAAFDTAFPVPFGAVLYADKGCPSFWPNAAACAGRILFHAGKSDSFRIADALCRLPHDRIPCDALLDSAGYLSDLVRIF